jgi:hypothetical protein
MLHEIRVDGLFSGCREYIDLPGHSDHPDNWTELCLAELLGLANDFVILTLLNHQPGSAHSPSPVGLSPGNGPLFSHLFFGCSITERVACSH